MKLNRRFFPLQISILVHGSILLLLVVLDGRPQDTIVSDIIDLDVYTTPLVATKPMIPSKPTRAVSPRQASDVNTKSASVSNDQETPENSDNAVPVPVADYLITEEPKVISEPKNKQRTDEARKNGYTGTAKLKILIDIYGNVRDVKLLNSLKFGLDERAIELARQVKLSPAKVEGKPVNVIRDFTITFKATD